MGKSKKDNCSYEGSVSNCTEVLNGPTGSATLLTWYQGNFHGVLNKLAGSEAMLGQRREEEHTLDSACS